MGGRGRDAAGMARARARRAPFNHTGASGGGAAMSESNAMRMCDAIMDAINTHAEEHRTTRDDVINALTSALLG
jgi:hypothetical protein